MNSFSTFPLRLGGLMAAMFLAANAFSAEWYAKGKGYEKCMYTDNGFLICREDYVNDFCYGKERTWINPRREGVWYHIDSEMHWFDKKLVAVRNLNSKCEYHGWSRFKLATGQWIWQCYLNNREMKDEDCKGFRKR